LETNCRPDKRRISLKPKSVLVGREAYVLVLERRGLAERENRLIKKGTLDLGGGALKTERRGRPIHPKPFFQRERKDDDLAGGRSEQKKWTG